jgi:hypothetical protein
VGFWKVEIDSRITIHLCRRNQIQQADWNIPAILIPYVERGPGEQVIVNPLRRPAVLENKRNRVLAPWGRGRTRKNRVELPGLESRRLIRLKRRLRIGSVGNGVRGSLRIVAVYGIGVSIRIGSCQSGNNVRYPGSVNRYIWPAIVPGPAIRRPAAGIAGSHGTAGGAVESAGISSESTRRGSSEAAVICR